MSLEQTEPLSEAQFEDELKKLSAEETELEERSKALRLQWQNIYDRSVSWEQEMDAVESENHDGVPERMRELLEAKRKMDEEFRSCQEDLARAESRIVLIPGERSALRKRKEREEELARSAGPTAGAEYLRRLRAGEGDIPYTEMK